jgi:hypothetical protein
LSWLREMSIGSRPDARRVGVSELARSVPASRQAGRRGRKVREEKEPTIGGNELDNRHFGFGDDLDVLC